MNSTKLTFIKRSKYFVRNLAAFERPVSIIDIKS